MPYAQQQHNSHKPTSQKPDHQSQGRRPRNVLLLVTNTVSERRNRNKPGDVSATRKVPSLHPCVGERPTAACASPSFPQHTPFPRRGRPRGQGQLVFSTDSPVTPELHHFFSFIADKNSRCEERRFCPLVSPCRPHPCRAFTPSSREMVPQPRARLLLFPGGPGTGLLLPEDPRLQPGFPPGPRAVFTGPRAAQRRPKVCTETGGPTGPFHLPAAARGRAGPQPSAATPGDPQPPETGLLHPPPH